MAVEIVEAKYQLKDENGNTILDDEGKPSYNTGQVNYDFGDNLDAAIALCGEEVVHSQYKANSKVALQSIIRAKLRAGSTPEQLQTLADSWKPGMVVEKTTVDPEAAIRTAFQGWSDEKKAEFLAGLGVDIG